MSLMGYLTSKDIGVISVMAAFWAIINATISPIFWRLTHLPFFCDLLALISLSITLWWTRKFGSGIIVGIIATLLNFVLRPGALFFLGFTVASVFFDIFLYLLKYERVFSTSRGLVLLVVSGVLSTWIAGLIIGTFFMSFRVIKAVLLFSVLHSLGGLIGSVLSIAIIKSLEVRRIRP